MSERLKASIIELDWSEARKDLIKVNPRLTKIIDNLNPNKKHTIFKTRYLYGDEILKRSKLYLPNPSGKLIAIDDANTDPHIRSSLDYNLLSNPVSVLLNNSAEIFLPLPDRTVPIFDLIKPGAIFGAFRILNSVQPSHHPAFIWDMTAGARSIFMLAKISTSEKHKKLKKMFSLDKEAPKNFVNHWEMFRQLANSKFFPDEWFIEILFFSKEWFSHLNDKAWLEFNNYLFQKVWDGSDYWRNIFLWNIIFTLMQRKLEIKVSPYIFSTVKHLLAISIGEAPGFVPAVDNTAAPITALQNIYIDIYKTKYAPIIMHPGVIDPKSPHCNPVYYSFSYATLLEFWQKSRLRDSFIDDILEVRNMLNNCIRLITANEYNVANTPLYDGSKNSKFEYFHTDIGDGFDGISKDKDILLSDQIFLQSANKTSGNFPINSAFFKGCVRISRLS
ncbi:MAG: hypothetical protein M1561_07755 [Gammaproteobacteria bacterium]|nr:hypothetical protein [Gammaproteobacteria bacterium]